MNESRGMIKYQPYQSLTEQASILSRMRYEKNKRPKPLISSDMAEEINEILVHYEREKVRARYYEDGYVYELPGVISFIDSTFKALTIQGKRIPFSRLVGLERLETKRRSDELEAP